MSKRRDEEDGFTVDAISEGLANTIKPKRQARPKPQRGTGGGWRTRMWGPADALGLDNDASPLERFARASPDPVFRPTQRPQEREEPTVDDGTIATRKAEAERITAAKGHRLEKWRKRTGDPYGRFDARCRGCNDTVTVCTIEPVDYKLALIYGSALRFKCNI